jgi:hypothetical protein
MAKECADCHARLLVLHRFPPLDARPSKDGRVAVTFTDPMTPRWLAKGEDAGPLEHRHNPHACDQAQLPQDG